jgi:hypothetical protein
VIVRAQALREQLKGLGRGHHATSRSQPTILNQRDLAEVAMHIKRDEAHLSPLVVVEMETRRATRQLPIRARSTPGHARGRPTTYHGLAAQTDYGLPNLRSPESPRPGHKRRR